MLILYRQTSKIIKPKVARIFKIVYIVELTIFIFITMYTLNFFFVEVHSAYGLMFVVFSLHFYMYRKTKNEGSKYMLIAVFIAAVSAFFYMNEISISKWFNYSDISHTIMAISAWIFYQGTKRLDNKYNKYGFQ